MMSMLCYTAFTSSIGIGSIVARMTADTLSAWITHFKTSVRDKSTTWEERETIDMTGRGGDL